MDNQKPVILQRRGSDIDLFATFKSQGPSTLVRSPTHGKGSPFHTESQLKSSLYSNVVVKNPLQGNLKENYFTFDNNNNDGNHNQKSRFYSNEQINVIATSSSGLPNIPPLIPARSGRRNNVNQIQHRPTASADFTNLNFFVSDGNFNYRNDDNVFANSYKGDVIENNKNDGTGATFRHNKTPQRDSYTQWEEPPKILLSSPPHLKNVSSHTSKFANYPEHSIPHSLLDSHFHGDDWKTRALSPLVQRHRGGRAAVGSNGDATIDSLNLLDDVIAQHDYSSIPSSSPSKLKYRKDNPVIQTYRTSSRDNTGDIINLHNIENPHRYPSTASSSANNTAAVPAQRHLRSVTNSSSVQTDFSDKMVHFHGGGRRDGNEKLIGHPSHSLSDYPPVFDNDGFADDQNGGRNYLTSTGRERYKRRENGSAAGSHHNNLINGDGNIITTAADIHSFNSHDVSSHHGLVPMDRLGNDTARHNESSNSRRFRDTSPNDHNNPSIPLPSLSHKNTDHPPSSSVLLQGATNNGILPTIATQTYSRRESNDDVTRTAVEGATTRSKKKKKRKRKRRKIFDLRKAKVVEKAVNENVNKERCKNFIKVGLLLFAICVIVAVGVSVAWYLASKEPKPSGMLPSDITG